MAAARRKYHHKKPKPKQEGKEKEEQQEEEEEEEAAAAVAAVALEEGAALSALIPSAHTAAACSHFTAFTPYEEWWDAYGACGGGDTWPDADGVQLVR
jgi:hypothetical protein